jgi:hypothetical protein
MPSQRVLDWLLEPEEPAVRYRTLRELLGRPESDPEVRSARTAITRTGWAADLLAERGANGGWEEGRQYLPKYLSTNWKMLVLSDLGLTKDDPTIARSCEYWFAGFPLEGGGLGGSSTGRGHHCVVGNLTRAAIRFGYARDPRVRRSLDWLVETASPLGGWSCMGSGRNLDSWEGLSAFAAYPRELWTASDRACVERAIGFFLERELHQQGGPYAPWSRFHYPVHYYYDLLVGLDLLTSLGRGSDPRLAHALRALTSKRQRDGRWSLDAHHPDVEGPIAVWMEKHPKQRPHPLELEPAGRPSKMVTLRALLVLDRIARGVGRPTDSARRPSGDRG